VRKSQVNFQTEMICDIDLIDVMIIENEVKYESKEIKIPFGIDRKTCLLLLLSTMFDNLILSDKERCAKMRYHLL
jgi:hypothetical protein